MGTVKVKATSQANNKKSAMITVKVVLGVKSVKTTKKTATVAVGGTTKINVKVKGPKGCYKGVVYSSKNKKVAKVNREGVITGVAEGIVPITATAADGTKKKATMTVTVTSAGVDSGATPIPNPAPNTSPTPSPVTSTSPTSNPVPGTEDESISIQSVTFMHAKRISVDLSKPIDLKREDFDISLVSRVDGSRCKADIKSVLTTDQQHYIINMSNSTDASKYDDYEVTISSLAGDGVKVMKNSTRKIVEVKNEFRKLRESWEFSSTYKNNTYYEGYQLVSAENLPDGITLTENQDKSLYSIAGTGNTSQDGIASTLTLEGPYGMSKVEHITWDVVPREQFSITTRYPGEDHISIGVGEDFFKYIRLNWTEGISVSSTSAEMRYIDGAPDGLEVEYVSMDYIELSGTVNTPGTYPIHFLCETDSSSNGFTIYVEVSPKTHLNMHIKDLSGQNYAATGRVLLYADGDFTKEPIELVMDSGEVEDYVPAGTYTVYVGGQFFEQVKIQGDNMEWNPVVDLYRVKCVNSTPNVMGEFVAMEDNRRILDFQVNTDNSEYFDYTDLYNLDKEFTGKIINREEVTYSATVRMVSMANGEITVELTASPFSKEVVDLGTIGEYKTIDLLKAGETLLTFTPTETATYYMDIKNDSYLFPYIDVYLDDNVIGRYFEEGADYYHMLISQELEAGKTYHIKTRFEYSNLNQTVSLAMQKFT